jgi:DnaJ-class molecular chaperone
MKTTKRCEHVWGAATEQPDKPWCIKCSRDMCDTCSGTGIRTISGYAHACDHCDGDGARAAIARVEGK